MSVNDLKLKLRSNVLRPTAMELFKLFPSLAASFRARKEMVSIRREADKFFAEGAPLPEGATRRGYYQAMEKYYVSISEYLHQYEFYKLSEPNREEFISRALMRSLAFKLKSMYPNDTNGLTRFKNEFLKHFTELGFVKRRWLFGPECTFEQFADLLSSTDCIIKPDDGSLGFGVKKVLRQTAPLKIRELYDRCVNKKLIIEEYVHNSPEIQAFHPSSLNTIRFVSIAFRGRARAFGAFLRMGVGDMVIDNAHAGGLFAQINIETGVIESDGITTEGLRVPRHPDTGIQIKGTPICRWDEIVEFCLSAARQTNNIISGWDVIVTDKGVIEFVEANNRPDFDVMQSPLKKGVKRKVLATLKDVIGKEITI